MRAKSCLWIVVWLPTDLVVHKQPSSSSSYFTRSHVLPSRLHHTLFSCSLPKTVREVVMGLVSANLYATKVSSSLIMCWVGILFVDSAVVPVIYFLTPRSRNRHTATQSGTRSVGPIVEILLDMVSLVIQAQIWVQIKDISSDVYASPLSEAKSVDSPESLEFAWQMSTLVLR